MTVNYYQNYHYTYIYVRCVQKVWKHPNEIETNDFREKRKDG
jgi:hypothetical protein